MLRIRSWLWALGRIAKKWRTVLGDAVDTVSDVGGSVTRAIQANPLAAILIAGTIGYVLAWTLSRD